MTVREELIAQLTRYDDDTWIALANRGLLRRARKDLITTTPELLTEDAETLEIQIGTATVQLDERGPANATCDCPSATTCQHIISAGLWLLTTATPPRDQPTGGHPEALLALGFDELVGYAGRAGYRWALRFVDDLEARGGCPGGGG